MCSPASTTHNSHHIVMIGGTHTIMLEVSKLLEKHVYKLLFCHFMRIIPSLADNGGSLQEGMRNQLEHDLPSVTHCS